MVYSERILKAAICRTGDWLGRKSWPVTTMLLAVIAAGFATYFASVTFDVWNWTILWIRLPLRIVGGYAAFLFVILVWFANRTSIGTSRLMKGATKSIGTMQPWSGVLEDQFDSPFGESKVTFGAMMNKAWESSLEESGFEAVIIWFLATILFGAIFVALHRVFYARWYLGELLVLTGKVQHPTSSLPKPRSWFIILFEQTKWELAVLLIHYGLLGALLQHFVPDATSFFDALSQLGPDRPLLS